MYHNRTRQLSASGPQAPTPVLETPKPEGKDALVEYFEQLRHQHGIALPYKERNSPSKRRKSPGHDAVKHMHYLFCVDKTGDTLSHALEPFKLQSPALSGIDEKLNLLLETLTIAVNSANKTRTPRSQRQWQAAPSPKSHGYDDITSMGPPTSMSKVKRTPGSTSSHWPPPSLQSTQIDNQPSPPSPTLSIKALSNKHTPKLLLDDIAKYPMLPPVMTQKPEVPNPAAGITSVNTSFATTSANTSFATTAANISFQFSEPQGSQEPVSPASSVDSMNMDGGNNAAKADSTQTTFYGTPPINPDDSSICDVNTTSAFGGTQTTNYGSSDIFDMSRDEPETPTRGPKMAAQSRNDCDHSSPHKETLQPPAGASVPSPVPVNNPTEVAGETRRDSPGKQPGEHVRVRDIPTHGISGGLSLSEPLLSLPFDLRFECARVMKACDLKPHEFEAQWNEPRDFESLQRLAKQIAPPTFQSKSKAAYENCSFHVNLRYTESKEKDKPLFEPELVPPGREPSTSWQRTFGHDRFLFVDSDSLSKPPVRLGLNKQKDHILQRFLEMLGEEQQFLGRTWLQFHVKTKASKRGGLAESKQYGAYGFIFVALRGDNGTLEPLTLHTIIDWALPLIENADASWCKLYARLDQRASRNTFVMLLTRDEIEEVDDDYATRDAPPTNRNDSRYAQQFKESVVYKEDVVMNDGCSEALESTMQDCGLALGYEHVPSAVQFRCGGAKGMIFMCRPTDDEDDHPDPPPPKIKIRLSKSQRKVIPKSRERATSKYDPHFFELSANAASHPVEHSYMYLDFLQILHACGVPAESMEELVLRRIDAYTKTLLEAMDGPEALRKWLYEQGSVMEERRRDNGIATIAGFPISDTEKAIQMLESGFEPAKFLPLATLVKSEVKKSVDRMIQGFRATLEQSTMVYGEADPTGSLEPQKVHLRFSKPLRDPATGKSLSHFAGYVLVSRLPAARASDIRCVWAEYRPELSHLEDTLIVSSKGPQPLADMCSGGDYDGDTFWVCKEPLLVKQFRNVPAPRELPDPTSLGIKVDKRTLREIIPDPSSEDQVRAFVRKGTANRIRQSWVGIVTKLHARVVHAKGLFSEAAIACADLKDRLMDSDKNGFSFDNEAFEAFKKKWDICNLPTPAYFQHTDKKDDDDDVREKTYQKADPNNVVDRIYCSVLAKEFYKAGELARAKLESATDHDPDLTAFYDRMVLQSEDSPVIRSELRHLRQKLTELKEFWATCTNEWSKCRGTRRANGAWNDAVLKAAKFYQSIEPAAKDSEPLVSEWCRGNGNALTTWDRLKASALVKFYEQHKLRFNVAGHELCRLKAEAAGKSRLLTEDAYLIVAPKKKRKRSDDEIPDNEDEMDVDAAGDEGGAVAGAEG